jgi:hypothetical protein
MKTPITFTIDNRREYFEKLKLEYPMIYRMKTKPDEDKKLLKYLTHPDLQKPKDFHAN